MRTKNIVALLFLFFIIPSLVAAQQRDSTAGPVSKLLKLNPMGSEYLPLLSGPPETSTMRSGLVTLKPEKNVGRHSTESNEEIVVALEGAGEMRITNGDTLKFGKGEAVYCPAHTEHDVYNTGKRDFRYIYIVAKAAPGEAVR